MIDSRDMSELRAAGYRVIVLAANRFYAPTFNSAYILPGPYNWYVSTPESAWLACWTHYLEQDS